MSENPSPSEGHAHDLNFAVCNLIAGGCGKQKPVEKFRVGGTICLACEDKSRRQEDEIRELAATQRVAARQIGKALIEAEKRRQRNLPPGSYVLNLIMEKFGGYEGYAEWAYKQAINSEEGSKTANDVAHRLMANLLEINRQEMGHDIETLNDEELVALLGQAALNARANIVDGTAKRIEHDDSTDADE